MKTSRDFTEYFHSRFGVSPDVWEPYQINIHPNAVYLAPSESPEMDGWNLEAVGFRVARPTTDGFKPGNRLLQYLNDDLKEGVITVTAQELSRILRRDTVEPADDHGLERGFVALQFQNLIVGCGFWTGNKLRTQMSKSISHQFPSIALNQD